MPYDYLRRADPEIYNAVMSEVGRQCDKLEMIASENFVSMAVLEALGTPLTNKYAEGYPGKRYYGGCEYVDIAETLAIERAKKLFGADHVNVQPHSGAQANTAVYFSVLEPGDTILGLDLSHGGHLTHGMGKNISGKYFQAHFYQVSPETGVLDYDLVLAKAREVRPKLIVAGASAYPRTLDFAKFREIADDVGAYLMVDMAHIAGLVAAGLHPDPVPFADFVTTTTHKTLRGPRGGMILCKEKYARAIDSAVFPGQQGGPLMHVIAAKAVAFGEALLPEFKDYQQRILDNASALADGLLSEGFELVSGGTDTHLMLIDLTKTGATGRDMQLRLDEVNITANKNGVPFDTKGPTVTSGIRVGTPAVTTRGLGTAEMRTIARLMKTTLVDFENSKTAIREEVAAICRKYPLYSDLV